MLVIRFRYDNSEDGIAKANTLHRIINDTVGETQEVLISPLIKYKNPCFGNDSFIPEICVSIGNSSDKNADMYIHCNDDNMIIKNPENPEYYTAEPFTDEELKQVPNNIHGNWYNSIAKGDYKGYYDCIG